MTQTSSQTWAVRHRENLLMFAAVLVAAVFAAVMVRQALHAPAQKAVAVPAPSASVVALLASPPMAQPSTATATFAGGCFWGVQAVFQHTQGVLNAVSGYAGGQAATAVYEQVSGGQTGHAETVQITYNPAQISYAQLLHIFFAVAHDPTEHNRQGPDVGTEYRSVVFFASDVERQVTEAYIAQINAAKVFARPVATQIAPLAGFYVAEPHHQNYAARNPQAPYIVQFDAPKIRALQAAFAPIFRAEPSLVPQ